MISIWWLNVWVGIAGLAGIFCGVIFYRMTDRYKLDRICKQELQARIEYYQQQNTVTFAEAPAAGEPVHVVGVTKLKISDKLERPPREFKKGDGWHPEDPE